MCLNNIIATELPPRLSRMLDRAKKWTAYMRIDKQNMKQLCKMKSDKQNY